MSASISTDGRTPVQKPNWRNGYGLIVMLFALLAFITPFFKEEVLGGRVGLLLILTAIVELLHGFRRATSSAQQSAWIGGAITMAMGLVLINSPLIATHA